jgi:peptidoglycan hydrolase CwlO-like protein
MLITNDDLRVYIQSIVSGGAAGLLAIVLRYRLGNREVKVSADAQFRNDLLEERKTLVNEISELRHRIDELESERDVLKGKIDKLEKKNLDQELHIKRLEDKLNK